MNITDYLLEVGRDEDPAIIDGDRSYTYAMLRQVCARMTAALSERGLVTGTRVGLLGPNSLHWVAAYLAAMKLGLVAVPFPTAWSTEMVDDSAEWVGCAVLIGDARAGQHVPAAWRDRVVTIDPEDASLPAAWPASQLPEDADAALMFTSGTTARPHAVRVTHKNLLANTESILGYLDLGPDDRMLVILPFSYCYGASLLQTHLRAGGSVVFCNTFAFPEVAVTMMEQRGCTGFAGVPSSYQMLLQTSTFAHRDLPTLRRLLQAGGKMHDTTIDQLVEAKPDVDLFVMYGQTEATARLSYLPPAYLGKKRGSIGRGIPGVELRVLDPQGHPVGSGEIGEICARGDNISPGYLEDPQETAQKFSEGMLHTGDMATVDEDGFIYVVGRKSDFIKTWGYRVSALEVEAELMTNPEVAAAAAFGVPDAAAGEAIEVAVVWAADAQEPTAEALLDRCRRTMARHLTPRRIHVMPQLPLNAAGKVDKNRLPSLVGVAEETSSEVTL